MDCMAKCCKILETKRGPQEPTDLAVGCEERMSRVHIEAKTPGSHTCLCKKHNFSYLLQLS